MQLEPKFFRQLDRRSLVALSRSRADQSVALCVALEIRHALDGERLTGTIITAGGRPRGDEADCRNVSSPSRALQRPLAERGALERRERTRRTHYARRSRTK